MNPKRLARKLLPKTGVKLAEETYRKGRIYTLQAAKGFPARGLRVIAVTGTNGKTTTCSYINEMLKAAGYKTAMFSTATVEVAGEKKPNKTHRTVPLTADLLAFFKRVKKANVDFVIMEITSQALDQHKMVGIPVEIAVMTNLTQEHLEYHGGMENYAAAKARLFNDYMHPAQSVLNLDDDWYDYFAKQSVGKITSYGKNPRSSVKIGKIQLTDKGSDFVLSLNGQEVKGHTSLMGEFNVYNAAAAAAVGLLLGLKPKQIIEGLGWLDVVSGRMEKVEAGQDFNVLVDYAITPDALAKALQALKQTTQGRVIVVFGATGGGRDKSKRPVMGEAAAKNADLIFLTDDEPYSEDPETIRQAVYKGIVTAQGQKKTTVIGDRKQAMKAAFAAAKKGDAILLAGIGHQDYRAMNEGKLPWQEAKVATELLKK